MALSSRKIKILSLIAFVCIGCTSKDKPNFKLNGSIKGFDKNIAILSYTIKDSTYKDSAKVTGGNFTFRGQLQHPTHATISLGKKKEIKVFIENSDINIRGNIDSLDKAKINGSRSQIVYSEFSKSRQMLSKKIRGVIGKIRKFEKVENEKRKKHFFGKLDSLKKRRKEVTKELISQYSNNYVSLLEMRNLVRNSNYRELSDLYEQFSGVLRKTDLGVEIQKYIKGKANTQLGGEAPNFSLQNLDGENISLKSFRGKYVLIDFWASWCKPCREEHPNYVNVYKKFKDQSFTILGVSLDRNKKNWKKAVKKDELSWTQLINDSGGMRSDVAKMYSIKSIPKNFLLNPEGEIIAMNLRGKDLKEKLNAILL